MFRIRKSKKNKSRIIPGDGGGESIPRADDEGGVVSLKEEEDCCGAVGEYDRLLSRGGELVNLMFLTMTVVIGTT